MISPKQVQKVRELFQQGTPKTTISKQTDVSRTKVAEIIKDIDLDNKESIQEDVESDPEIITLKKELAKEQLRRKIREQRQPFEIEKKLKELEEQIDSLEFSYYGSLIIDDTWKCKHCKRKGKIALWTKCTNCDEESWQGWFPKE